MESEFVEVPDGDTLWRFERSFLESRWTCIWGRGCLGILDHPAEALQQGCCSVGAELADPEEAMTVSALAATIDPALWQFHDRIDGDDVFKDATRTNTKVVDGACMFLNRPGFAGGAGCALLLQSTSDDRLRQLIPVLLGLATLLLALQPRLRIWLGRHAAAADRPDAAWLVPGIALGAVYGGYFGAGLGVMMLAMLGLGVHQPLNRSNVLKQLLAFVINFVAALFFVFTGKVWWGLAGLMAAGSLLGGVLGGRVAGRLNPERFRLVVVAVGTAVTIAYAVKVWF